MLFPAALYCWQQADNIGQVCSEHHRQIYADIDPRVGQHRGLYQRHQWPLLINITSINGALMGPPEVKQEWINALTLGWPNGAALLKLLQPPKRLLSTNRRQRR